MSALFLLRGSVLLLDASPIEIVLIRCRFAGNVLLSCSRRSVRPARDKVIGISTYTSSIDACAFEKADGRIVLIVLDRTDCAMPFVARIGAWSHEMTIDAPIAERL